MENANLNSGYSLSSEAEQRLMFFINTCCERYAIDESHGLPHAQNTMKWVEKLLAAESKLSDDEGRLCLYGAALHDMCDAKYTDIYEAGAVIFTWLTAEEGWNNEEAAALIRIIHTTSYSKLKLALRVNPKSDCPGYPDHGQWQRVFHIIRHADLLEGYNVRRCMLYTRHRLQQTSETDCWSIVDDIFQHRVLQYVSDGWIFLPQALIYATELDAGARQALMDKIY